MRKTLFEISIVFYTKCAHGNYLGRLQNVIAIFFNDSYVNFKLSKISFILVKCQQNEKLCFNLMKITRKKICITREKKKGIQFIDLRQ